VLDLSSLWAGPLCAHLLSGFGADVITLDSVARPDGARLGDAQLFELLHRGTTARPVDLRTSEGRAELRSLIDAADIVITSARPRALQQLGLWPADEVTRRPGLTWVAITGYGLTGPWCNRVAYGDDAAAAGGLVVSGEQPVFCADAAADPATGLYSAIAAIACATSGGGVVDVALRDVAAHLAAGPRLEPPCVRRDRDGWLVETPAGPVPVAPARARLA
jgi:crotonobetainyl-CoA:carnitine CoA-transferase CaiB-like acyl-CoA transferase